MAVAYPDTVKTDRDRLAACYSLLRQFRDEGNRQAAVARADQKGLAGLYRAYARKQRKLMKPLLAEKNALVQALIDAAYTREEWKSASALPLEERQAIYDKLLVDKSVAQLEDTKAVSDELEKLKLISLKDQKSVLFSDPTEDLTGYTEVDPASYLSTTADKATYASLPRSVTAYYYYDKGAAHFDGNFDIRLQNCITAYNNYGLVVSVGLSNGLGHLWAGQDELSIALYNRAAGPCLRLEELYSSSGYYDLSDYLSYSTTYYVQFERDEGVGTYGTLYGYISTGDYWDDGGSQVDTVSLELHAKVDYRYVMVCQSANDGQSTYYISGWVQYIDLQEPSSASRGWWSK